MPITKSDFGLTIVRKAKGFCKVLIPAQSVRRTNHQAGLSISCEDLALPSNTSTANHRATFSFNLATGKETRRPPYLVSAAEVL
jgi:hypothetical protein